MVLAVFFHALWKGGQIDGEGVNRTGPASAYHSLQLTSDTHVPSGQCTFFLSQELGLVVNRKCCPGVEYIVGQE